ncbi:MAG: N-acetyltransferase [Alphaproteobacteria bacterium]|nr:MAG: N-acetyltransferase [Alphaproteobacteria bacterium]
MPTIAVDPAPEILTKRLCLRFSRMDDLDRLVELIGNIDVARYLARVPYPYSRQDGEDFIRATMNGVTRDGELIYAIADRTDDSLIGACGLILGGDAVELGYWVGAPYWRRGFAREAVTALIDLAFGPLGLRGIYADVAIENQPSRALLAALGFQQTGKVPVYQMVERRSVAGVRFELEPDHWKGAHW